MYKQHIYAKTAFQFLRPHAPIVVWWKSIWSKFIMPRMSLLAWKILHGRVLSDDFLQKRGVSLASRCGLCCRSVESLHHIFLNCSFAASVWNNMVTKFELGLLPNSILEVFHLGLHASRSNQLRELWLLCFTSVLWFIWNARNKAKYDGKVVQVDMVCRLISGHINASSCLVSGSMHNTRQDLRVLKCFGARCNLRHAPKIFEVNWHPPPFGWVKINTDGAWRSGLGLGGYGGCSEMIKAFFWVLSLLLLTYLARLQQR